MIPFKNIFDRLIEYLEKTICRWSESRLGRRSEIAIVVVPDSKQKDQRSAVNREFENSAKNRERVGQFVETQLMSLI